MLNMLGRSSRIQAAQPVVAHSSHGKSTGRHRSKLKVYPATAVSAQRLKTRLCRAEPTSGHGESSMQDPEADSGRNSVSASKGPSTGSSRLLQTDPVQLSELLVRLSQLQVTPHQQWLHDVLDTLQPRLQELSAAQLSSMLRVLGGWGFMPSEPFMAHWHAAVLQQLGTMSMRHLADMAWGLAQLQNPKQPLLNELLQAALDLMQGNHCSASAVMAHHTAGQEQGGCELSQQQAQPLTCCPASLADIVWSVAKLQHNPSSAWLNTFAAISLPLLDSFTPHQLAQVIWAFARLPYQPSQPWMDGFLAVVRDKLTEFDSASVSLTAWGLATLKAQPNTRWLFAFERQAERTLSTLAAAELACTLWALSELKAKRAHELRLGRLVRRQEVFWDFDYEALANPRLLRVVRQLTLGPQRSRG